MKIVHVYSQNLQMFVDAVQGTDCRLNASRDLNYLLASLQNYNARDVLGLIVFANPMTKKCIKLVEKFDQLYIYHKMPVVIVNDRATDLYKKGYFKVKNAQLYMVDSEENSISDIDVASIFTTLLASSDAIYDLSGCEAERRKLASPEDGEKTEMQVSESLADLLNSLEGKGLM